LQSRSGFLRSGVTTATLKDDGKVPDERDALNKAVMNGDRLLLYSLSNQVGIGSNHDCLFGISRISFSISASVTHWQSDMLTKLSAASRMTGGGSSCVAERISSFFHL